MIPASFNYKKATSVNDAIEMMSEDSKVLGGGQSLIPAMKLRLNMISTLIDISKIDSIKGIKENDMSITIGSGTTHAEIANSSILAEHCPMMCAAAKEIGDIQVRNKGTIGGSIAHADPAADWPAVLLAADANVNIQNANGKRTVDIDQFFKGFYETALEDGEIIISISIPKTGFNKNSTYVKFKQPASRFAIVGVAVAKDSGTTRIGVTGLADCAFRAMSVETALKNGSDTDSALESIDEGVSVMSDHYASERYRTHLAKVMAKRALALV